jgi:hypothetical protein
MLVDLDAICMDKRSVATGRIDFCLIAVGFLLLLLLLESLEGQLVLSIHEIYLYLLKAPFFLLREGSIATAEQRLVQVDAVVIVSLLSELGDSPLETLQLILRIHPQKFGLELGIIQQLVSLSQFGVCLVSALPLGHFFLIVLLLFLEGFFFSLSFLATYSLFLSINSLLLDRPFLQFFFLHEVAVDFVIALLDLVIDHFIPHLHQFPLISQVNIPGCLFSLGQRQFGKPQNILIGQQTMHEKPVDQFVGTFHRF